ncbi:mannose-1-phosphate guanylyltransferase [Thermodesulfobacteriota bacterium]
MYSVIMAGGSGTRFWPYSRKERPKQLLNITGKGPLVLDTCDRLQPLSKDEEIIIVLGKDHCEETRSLLADRQINILAEPVGRNTAPCIALGALYARHLGCDGPVAFLPADHYIGNVPAFLDCLEHAGKACESGGIVTLGIIPTRPETGYGYIRGSLDINTLQTNSVFPVSAFVEKPDINKALEYIQSGDYFWNAGIFVAMPDTILNETGNLLPETYDALMKLEPCFGKDSFEDKLNEVYSDIESISFDYGIMEKTDVDVSVVPCECGWSDVGSWESLYELRSEEHDNNKNLEDGDTLLVDCENSYVAGMGNRLVTCLGLKDCIVIDREDALLVTHMKKSQDIRKIVDELKRKKREELL